MLIKDGLNLEPDKHGKVEIPDCGKRDGKIRDKWRSWFWIKK